MVYECERHGFKQKLCKKNQVTNFNENTKKDKSTLHQPWAILKLSQI